MNFSVIKFKNVRFTLYSPISLKIEYSPTGKFIDNELFVTDLNNIQKTDFNYEIKKNQIKITTQNLIIFYKNSKNFLGRNLKIYYKFGEKYKKWYYGKNDKKNSKGPTLDLFKYPEIRGKNLPNGVLSKNGYFVYEDNSFFFWNSKRDWAFYNQVKDYKIIFFIGYGNDYKRALFEYSKIFGKVPMIPNWAFGYWFSRWFPYHQNDFIKIVKKYRAHKIPIDVVVIDTDWRKNVWNGYDWSEKYFPEPDKFIKEMKKLNIHLTLNDHPGYNSSEILPLNDSHLKFFTKERKEWRCNWLNKKDVKLFCEKLLLEKLKQGIDFWWVDGWGADGLPVIEEFLEKNKNKDKMALGTSAYIRLNPQLWLNHFYYKTTEKFSKKRAIILSRFGGIGSHRYPVCFTGDTYSNWKTLKYEVYYTHTAGNLLCNFVSHDLGGFLGEKIPKDLYIRWIQFGALSPIMRTHSSKSDFSREPFIYDNQTVEIFKNFTRLRYKILPYFYKLNFESYMYAKPIVRSLYYEFPDDKNCYKFKYQYLLGDSILVAPVVSKSSKIKIYFPEGEWLNIWTGEIIKGKCFKKFKVPLNIIPVFVRKGSIIPINTENTLFIKSGYPKNLQFEIFPSNKEINFEYYEDDGVSLDYNNNKYNLINISFKNNILTISKSSNFIKTRKINLIFHYPENIKKLKCFINKKPVKVLKTKKLFNELSTPFNSYLLSFNYNGKNSYTIKLILDFQI